MLMRKRAWDIAREDYVHVDKDDSLVEAMKRLLECVKSGNGCLCALVFDGPTLLGAVSIWDTVRFMNSSLKEAGLSKETDEGDFETLFNTACRLAAATRVTAVMDKDFTVIPPDYIMPSILSTFVRKGRSYGVVMEGAKTIGVIMIQDIFEELGAAVGSRL